MNDAQIRREQLSLELEMLHIEKQKLVQRNQVLNKKLSEFFRKQKKHIAFIEEEGEYRTVIYDKYNGTLKELLNVRQD